jgi:hypothetical protein
MERTLKIMKTCAAALGLLLGFVSVAAALFDVKSVLNSYLDNGATYTRSFEVSDPRGRSHRVRVSLSREAVDKSLENFGISRDELRQELIRETERFTGQYGKNFRVEIYPDLSYRCQYPNDSEYLVKEYKKFFNKVKIDYFKEHFIWLNNNVMLVDYPALQKWQAPALRPVYDSLYSIANSSPLNEREFITLMTNFVQRIPYKIPPEKQNGRETLGVWPPVVCLKEGSGDCDTKSTLFATIYTHYRKNGSIMLITPKHAFIGIKDQHRVFPRDKTVRIGGREFLLTEMTNPVEMGRISQKEMSHLKTGKFRYVEMN